MTPCEQMRGESRAGRVRGRLTPSIAFTPTKPLAFLPMYALLSTTLAYLSEVSRAHSRAWGGIFFLKEARREGVASHEECDEESLEQDFPKSSCQF